VGDFRVGVDQPSDLVEALLRHRHRAEGERAAECGGVVHRPEPGQDAILAQPRDRPDQLVLVQAEAGRHLGERARDEREAALQRIHDPAVGGTQHGRSGAA